MISKSYLKLLSLGYVPFGRLKKKCTSIGTWSGSEGTCQEVYCPKLELGPNVLVMPQSCSTNENRVRQKCKFSCPPGFKLVGSKISRCRRNKEWKYQGGPPKCIEIERNIIPPPILVTTQASVVPLLTPTSYSQPYIYCPPDVTKDLPVDSASILVRIPQPKTNVDWNTNVRATPDWAKDLEATLPLGKTLVTFQAMSPVTNEATSCSFTIHIKDTVPPRVYNCPNDFHVYLDEGQIKKQVNDMKQLLLLLIKLIKGQPTLMRF